MDALAAMLSLLDVGTIREAADYVNSLSPEDRSVVTTWLVFEGITRLAYYILVFLAVFLLGRRMIQAMIAGYREARAESV
jgi:hypothetical protein